MTGINVFNDYVRFLKTREVSPRTIEIYLGTITKMAEWISEHYDADFNQNNVKGYMISNWATSISNMKPSTKANYTVTVKMFLQFLYNMQYVDFDLSVALPKQMSLEKAYKIHPEQAPNKHGYTIEQVRLMLDEPVAGRIVGNTRKDALIVMLVMSGLRISELLSLKIKDVITDEDFMMVARKGTHGNKVKVPIPKGAIPYVNKYLSARFNRKKIDKEDWLFVDDLGTQLSRSKAYTIVSALQKRLGIQTGLHTFRHTALTLAAKSSDPVVARDLAGQKSINITNRYLHSTDEELIAATDKIGKMIFE